MQNISIAQTIYFRQWRLCGSGQRGHFLSLTMQVWIPLKPTIKLIEKNQKEAHFKWHFVWIHLALKNSFLFRTNLTSVTFETLSLSISLFFVQFKQQQKMSLKMSIDLSQDSGKKLTSFLSVYYRGRLHYVREHFLLGEGSLYGWSPVLLDWIQLFHNIQISTNFIFWSNTILFNWRPAVQWSFPLWWVLYGQVKNLT